MFDLDRFKVAQADPQNGFDVALRELEAGRKRSHWIWYVFPQLAGLGASAMATRYGLRDIDEAMAYIRDALLRGRLLAVARAAAAHLSQPAVRLAELMGSDIDARKVVSSMTLFREIALRVREGSPGELAELAAHTDAILNRAAEQGIPPCAFTLARLQNHRIEPPVV